MAKRKLVRRRRPQEAHQQPRNRLAEIQDEIRGERSISFGSRGDPCCSRKCLPLKMIPASRLVVRT